MDTGCSCGNTRVTSDVRGLGFRAAAVVAVGGDLERGLRGMESGGMRGR